MKNFTLLTLLLIFSSLAFAVSHEITFPNYTNGIKASNVRSDDLRLDLSISSLKISEITDKNGSFTHLSVQGFIGTSEEGLPELPYLGKLITVPENASVSVNIIKNHYSTISLQGLGFESPVYPAQPSYRKSADLSTVEFVYNQEKYLLDDYDKDYQPFKVVEVGYLRGHRIFEVIFTPVHYNPVKNELTIYDSMDIELSFENANHSLTQYNREKTWSADFEKVYQSQLINYQSLNNRNTLERYPTKYVIISYNDFYNAMEVFADWKTQQGYEVIHVSTADPAVGNSTSSIKSYLQGLWNAATPDNPAPSYVLFVGDVAQIPAWSAQAGSGYITDLSYVRLEGTDYLPEMYYGRFSANNINELMPQINKTMMYQRYEMPDPSYLEEVVLISGMDSSFANSHGNGQINYTSNLYFNAENGYPNPNIYLYPGSGSQSTSIVSNVSQGASWVNYTAHGDVTNWSDPSFTMSHINSLQNYGKYPVVIGNCCLTNKFEQNCFGEAWLRANDKGAVIYIGGNSYTYWNEDYWWAVGLATPPSNGSAVPYNANQLGMYDHLFHTHGEVYEDWQFTTGAMVYTGNMVVQSSSSSRKNYYWEIYSIMGDPSLVPYLSVPENNLADYPQQILLGQNQINIMNSAPYARVALSYDNIIHGTGFTDENGSLELIFEPFTIPGDAKLVITAQKYAPVIQDIQVIPSDGAYIILNNVVNLMTGNNSIDFASLTNLQVTVNNIGTSDISNLTAVLSSNSSFVQVINASATIESIEAESIHQISEFFTVNVDTNVLGSSFANLLLTVSDSSTPAQVWTIPVNLPINAPTLTETNFEIIDTNGNNNGKLDPGETAEIKISFYNSGNLPSLEGNITIASTNPAVSITQDNNNISIINNDEEIDYYFTVTVDENADSGSLTNISYIAEFYSQQIINTHALSIGLMVEDFETGDFSAFDWQHSGNQNWTVANTGAFEGTYAAKSGTINHNQTSVLQLNYLAEAAGQIEFAVKVSSENNYDFLKFYINDNEQGSWSGTVDWNIVSFNVNPGNNVFKWTYSKDGSVSSGSDCAWIDYIVFPAAGGGDNSSPVIHISQNEINMGTVNMGQSVTSNFNIVNIGNEDLSVNITLPDNFVINTENTLNLNPLQSIQLQLSFESNIPGIYQDNIVFSSNDPNNPEILIPVQVIVSDETGLVYQNLNFIEGWNIMSSYVIPQNPDFLNIFENLINSNSLVKIQNQAGSSVEYLNSNMEWVNSIGNIQQTEAYRVKVNNNSSLNLLGIQVDLPLSISLSQGWNLISYPYYTQSEAIDYIQTLIDNEQLVKVIDEAGNTIEILPEIGFINNIHNFAPGKGYAIKVTENTQIVYPEYTTTIVTKNQTHNDEIKLDETTHFEKVWQNNGWNHFNLFIVVNDVIIENLSEGDEIALFDGDYCVASTVFNGQSNYISLTASLNDGLNNTVNGYSIDNQWLIKVWKSDTEIEIINPQVELLLGSNSFGVGESTVIKFTDFTSSSDIVSPQVTEIHSIYPNPFNPTTNISFSIHKAGNINLEVFNIKGQRINTLASGHYESGKHNISWHGVDNTGKRVASGVYFTRLVTEDKQVIKKMVLIK